MSETKKIPVNPNLKVEGFNPEDYVSEYTNARGEKLSRLPFNAQLMWFRLRYPDGKISVETRPGNNVIIAKARVYADRKDPVDAFIAEGESSRGPSPDMPSVNPRNWAQTAAIATALRYAGFGLEYDLAGEEPETITGEWDALMEGAVASPTSPKPNQTINNVNRGGDGSVDARVPEGTTVANAPAASNEPDYENMSEDEALSVASNVVLTNGKYKGKTVAQVLAENNRYANYVLNNFDHSDPVYKAVKVMTDAAMRYAD